MLGLCRLRPNRWGAADPFPRLLICSIRCGYLPHPKPAHASNIAAENAARGLHIRYEYCWLTVSSLNPTPLHHAAICRVSMLPESGTPSDQRYVPLTIAASPIVA